MQRDARLEGTGRGRSRIPDLLSVAPLRPKRRYREGFAARAVAPSNLQGGSSWDEEANMRRLYNATIRDD